VKVFISGIGGYLGSSLDKHLRLKGVEVVGSSHALPRGEKGDHPCGRVYHRTLEMAPDPLWFQNCDAIIHCAYDPKPGSGEKNIQSTKRLAEVGRQAGVRHQIFFSSHSAREDSASDYGRQKWALERHFLETDQLVLRPGMVIGPGGIFATNAKIIMGAPIIFLPRPRLVPVYYISHEDLMASVLMVLESETRGAMNLFVDPPTTLRDFVDSILRVHNQRKLIVPLPMAPFHLLARLAESIFIPTRSNFERLGVMVQNTRSPNYYSSHLSTLISQPIPLGPATETALLALDRLNPNALFS
jgi:NADH dehydrogenase